MAARGEVKATYTCSDYRDEMRLMGLKRRLEAGGLTEEEKGQLQREIVELETRMGLD